MHQILEQAHTFRITVAHKLLLYVHSLHSPLNFSKLLLKTRLISVCLYKKVRTDYDGV